MTQNDTSEKIFRTLELLNMLVKFSGSKYLLMIFFHLLFSSIKSVKSNDRQVNTRVVNLTLEKSFPVVPARKFKWTWSGRAVLARDFSWAGPLRPETSKHHFKSGRELTFNNYLTNIDESIYLYCQYNNQSKVFDFIESKLQV